MERVATMTNRLFSVAEAAAATGYSASWIYQNHDKPAGLPSIQSNKGRKLRFRQSDIENFNGGS